MGPDEAHERATRPCHSGRVARCIAHRPKEADR